MAKIWLQKPENRMAYMEAQSGKGIVIMDEYISMEEFCRMTGYKKQSVYNKIYRKELELGKHYTKPTRKKILFKRGPILEWLEGESPSTPESPEVRDATQGRISI